MFKLSCFINGQKAYDLFCNYTGRGQGQPRVDWEFNSHLFKNETVFYGVHLWCVDVPSFLYVSLRLSSFLDLQTILNILGFEINQTRLKTDTKYDQNLFQCAVVNGMDVSMYKLLIDMGADYEVSFIDEKRPWPNKILWLLFLILTKEYQ